jgi:hypothetical protein
MRGPVVHVKVLSKPVLRDPQMEDRGRPNASEQAMRAGQLESRIKQPGAAIVGEIWTGFDVEDEITIGTRLICVTVMVNVTWYNRRYGLVLKSADEYGSIYKRVGCFWDAREDFFKGEHSRVVTIG